MLEAFIAATAVAFALFLIAMATIFRAVGRIENKLVAQPVPISISPESTRNPRNPKAKSASGGKGKVEAVTKSATNVVTKSAPATTPKYTAKASSKGKLALERRQRQRQQVIASGLPVDDVRAVWGELPVSVRDSVSIKKLATARTLLDLLSESEIDAIDAYIAASGNYNDGAELMGVQSPSFQNYLWYARRKLNASNNTELVSIYNELSRKGRSPNGATAVFVTG